MRRGHVMGVRRHRRAGQLGVGAPPARATAPGLLEDEERGGLADGHAAAVAVEGPARLGVEQLERIEAHEADARERVDAADQRHVDHAVADQVRAERDGGGAGCARHHQRLARALEPEAEGHRVGVRARQDGAKGAPPGRGPPAPHLTPVPRLGLVHAAAHRPDEAGRPAPIPAVERSVGQRLGRRREREPVGPRAPARHPEPRQHLRGHLRGHAGAQPLRLDGGDRPDGAGARGQARPQALDARRRTGSRRRAR